MVKGIIYIWMDLSMKETDLKTNLMVLGQRSGKMALDMKDNMIVGKKMEWENFFGVMDLIMKDNFIIIIFMVLF